MFHVLWKDLFGKLIHFLDNLFKAKRIYFHDNICALNVNEKYQYQIIILKNFQIPFLL